MKHNRTWIAGCRLGLAGLGIAGVLVVGGCGGDKPEATDGGTEKAAAPAAATSGPKTYTIEQLSKTAKLGDKLPPLDSGRVELSPPEGWKVLPRDAKRVVALLKDGTQQVPQIKVLSRESPITDVDNLTPANVKEVLPKMGLSVARPSAEPNTPIILGPNAWIREVRKAELAGEKVALQSLTTIRGKRLFIIELIVAAKADGDYAEELKKYRDFAYLMAAEMKFLKPEAAIETAEASAEPTTPATEEKSLPAEEAKGEQTPAAPAAPGGEENPKAE